MSLVDLLWDKACENLYISREEFERSLDGWSIKPILLEGEEIGAALRRGTEFHFALFKKRVIPRSLVVKVFMPQLDEFGYLTTRTPRHEERQQRFNERFGFVQVGGDDLDIYYRLDRSVICR